ncbi:MAG TPA: hypothetical protein DCP28_19195, partial [Cytophagales bacterium]|nr:hypothetical protein [Cytophagales bacterium]
MMLQMVTNMLDVQKFEEAKMQLEARHLRLHDLVSKAAEQVGLLVQAKSLSLKNEVDPTHVIHGDEGLLIRIFLNLFTNAIKYCDPGGQIRVEALTLTGGRIEVSVQDDGQGMDAESRKHVFDKYFQAKARKSGKTRSTGLGLTFCQMAIEAHQGSIRVDSATHLGTRFIFDLPEGHVSSRDSEMAETPADFSPPIPVALGAGDWTQLGDLPARLRATPMYKAKVIRT